MDYTTYNISHDVVTMLTNIFAPDPLGPLPPFHAYIHLSVPGSTQSVKVVGAFVGPGIVGKAVGYRFALEDGQYVNALPESVEWIDRSPKERG